MSNNVFLAPIRAIALLYMCRKNPMLTDMVQWRCFDVLIWCAIINKELDLIGSNKVIKPIYLNL